MNKIESRVGASTTQRSLMTSKIVINLIVLGVVILWSIPTFSLLVSSFRGANAIRSSGWWTVFGSLFEAGQWTLDNYVFVITNDKMGLAFLNSLLVTLPATVIPITIAAFASYGIAWMNFRGRKLIFVFIVGMLVVPLQMALIPLFKQYTSLGINGTFLGIWMAHTGFGLPLATYLLFGFISGLPRDIIEAARIDGATPMTTFVVLILPLTGAAIAAFAVFQFLWVWNDLLVALIFLGTREDVALVTTRLSEMVGSRGQDWHVLTAGAFISMTIPLVVFFSLQRFFVRGIVAGSVKG